MPTLRRGWWSSLNDSLVDKQVSAKCVMRKKCGSLVRDCLSSAILIWFENESESLIFSAQNGHHGVEDSCYLSVSAG
jgi:hypothetical protein